MGVPQWITVNGLMVLLQSLWSIIHDYELYVLHLYSNFMGQLILQQEVKE